VTATLTFIVPSRGRPEKLAPLAGAFRGLCAEATDLIVSIDDDDPRRAEYVEVVEGLPGVGVVVGGNTSMAEALNRAAEAVDSWAIGFLGDDHMPRTPGFDLAYVKALRDLGTGIVYGDDLVQRQNLPTQVAMTSDIVRTLGYMTPPGLGHMYLDNFWRDLGRGAGCLRYLPDVVVEHVHPVAGKAAWDEGYARVNDAAVYERDRIAYARYRATRFPADVAKVRALRGAP